MRNRLPFSRLIPLVALLSLILGAGYIKFGRQTLGNNRYTAADGLEINPLGVGYESYCAELNPKGIGPCLAHNLQVIVDLSIACKSEEPCTLDASRLKGRVEGEAGVGKAAAQEYSPSAFFGCYIANLRERGLGAEFILPGQSSLVQVAYQPGVLVDHFGDHKDFVFSLIYENDHQRTAISVPESPATSVFGKPSGRVSQMILTPHWSPDGTRIAFRGYLDGQDGIWLVNADGFDLHPLATNLSDHAPVTWLSWSPDGGQIAYIASEKGSASLWVMDADGSQPVRIVEGVFGFTDAGWSPDGSKIAFDLGPGVGIVSRDGSDLIRLAEGNGSKPSWSPSGKHIALTLGYGEGIAIADADGTNTARLLEGQDPAWSPDGTRLAYFVDEERMSTPSLWVAAADGSNATQLTDDISLNFRPSWSPDGKKILFLDSLWNANVINADGSHRVLLTGAYPPAYPLWFDAAHLLMRGRDHDVWLVGADSDPFPLTGLQTRDPAPSPDGSRVALVTDSCGRSDLWVVDLHGGPNALTANGARVAQDSGPDDQQIALVAYRNVRWDVWVVSADGSNPIHLIENTDVLSKTQAPLVLISLRPEFWKLYPSGPTSVA